MSRMPNLPVDSMCEKVSDSDAEIVRKAFRKSGDLRATKPFKRATTLFEGQCNYVWRMLCYDYCDFHPHCCMPVTADFDISAALYNSMDRDERWEFVKKEKERLDEVVKLAESALSVLAQAGALRWARAFGMV